MESRLSPTKTPDVLRVEDQDDVAVLTCAPSPGVPEAPPSGNDESADPKLMELVSLRAAQIRHCPTSIEVHQKKLASLGETPEQLEELETWPTSTRFNDQDRAALTLCEEITMDPAKPLSSSLIREMGRYFTRETIIRLTLTIMAVNDWSYLGGA